MLARDAISAIWDYVSDTGEYPPSNQSAGMAKSMSITGSYVSSVDVMGGVIKVLFDGPKANSHLTSASKYLVLSPVMHAGSIDWTCEPSTVDGKYLPTVCRT